MVALNVAGERAGVRKVMASQSNEKAKAANPGPLKTEEQYHEWEPKFINYLSTIMGVSGVPLSYITRPKDIPDRDGPEGVLVVPGVEVLV